MKKKKKNCFDSIYSDFSHITPFKNIFFFCLLAISDKSFFILIANKKLYFVFKHYRIKNISFIFYRSSTKIKKRRASSIEYYGMF